LKLLTIDSEPFILILTSRKKNSILHVTRTKSCLCILGEFGIFVVGMILNWLESFVAITTEGKMGRIFPL